MKFNWGHGLLVFFIIYVGIIVAVLFKSFTVDHFLVAEDYYAKDLSYQTHLDKVNNFKNSDRTIVLLEQEGQFELLFSGGSGQEKGECVAYTPLDPALDKTFTFDRKQQSEVIIQNKEWAAGRWILKVSWEDEGKEFYDQHEVYIQQP
jgi:hypothetical protein